MSTEARIQTDQSAGSEPPDVNASRATPTSHSWDNPQTLIQESIKYRRRAQEAERRAESLETEVQSLRQNQEGRAAELEADLTTVRGENESLRGRIEAVERDRQLEREFLRGGCADLETALAVAHERLASGAVDLADPAALARSLLEEKPHLRGESLPGTSTVTRGLPPRTAAAKSGGASSPRRNSERLADQARQSGNPVDLMAYMRARRGAVA